MSKVHLREIELACCSDREIGVDMEMAEHLHWCARCRSAVADYCWLQGEIADTLAVAADAVVVPRPKWWAVRDRLFASRQRQIVGWRVSAVASIVSAVCLMLSVSPVLSTAAVARTLPPEAVVAPVPATVSTDEHLASLSTPTPAIPCEEATPSPTPAFMLPPTPPEPEV